MVKYWMLIKKIIQGEGGIEYAEKTAAAKGERGVGNGSMLTLTDREGGSKKR